MGILENGSLKRMACDSDEETLVHTGDMNLLVVLVDHYQPWVTESFAAFKALLTHVRW